MTGETTEDEMTGTNGTTTGTGTTSVNPLLPPGAPTGTGTTRTGMEDRLTVSLNTIPSQLLHGIDSI